MKTIKDLTIDELKNVVTDLEKGMKYNDVKTKYSLASNAVNYNTIADCKKLIDELTPTPEPTKCTGCYGIQHTTPEEHEKLLSIGVIVDKDGHYCW